MRGVQCAGFNVPGAVRRVQCGHRVGAIRRIAVVEGGVARVGADCGVASVGYGPIDVSGPRRIDGFHLDGRIVRARIGSGHVRVGGDCVTSPTSALAEVEFRAAYTVLDDHDRVARVANLRIDAHEPAVDRAT